MTSNNTSTMNPVFRNEKESEMNERRRKNYGTCEHCNGPNTAHA
ncbi:14598_t:CDS:1, partial [Funneliformis mosseae]